MAKVALFALNASYSHTNLAVRCIKKSLAENNSCEAFVLECNLKDKRQKILEALNNAAADIYGFSAYIWNVRELCEFAADLKRLRPSSLIVLGGPEASYNADELLSKNPSIDCVITGEGEHAFSELVRKFDSGEEIARIIDGGVYAEFESQGNVYGDESLGSRMLYYESSRGCPYRCAYCLSALSGKIRAKTAEQTLSELLYFEKYDGLKIIKFVDRTFNFDRERAKLIWRGLLSEQYTKNYHFEICAELLDEESFELLSQFPKGKLQLEIGVQSTNKETLGRINRPQNTEVLLSNISRLHSFGNMHIHADLIAGLPCEGFESFARSFDAVFGRCDMLQLGFLKLLHGSELRRAADEFGCVYSDRPPYEVLFTDSLSFAELCRLHEIDDLLDRYVNSGSFVRSFKLLCSRFGSPFYMLDLLAERFLGAGIKITELSQPRAYEMLYAFIREGEDEELAKALSLDFLTCQRGTPPTFGDFCMVRLEDDAKHRFISFAREEGVECFVPALEVRGIGEARFIIERRSLRAYEECGGVFVEV